MNTATQTNGSQTEDKYFDLHTSGLAYAYDFREVSPRGGRRFTPFCAVRLSALRGKAGAVEYTPYDAKVVSKKVCELLREHVDAINDRNTKVLVHFKIGDEYPEIYWVDEKAEDGRVTGRKVPRVSMKARLINVYKLIINGHVVYERKNEEEGEGGSDDANMQGEAPLAESAAPAGDDAQGVAPVDILTQVQEAIEDEAMFISLEKEDPKFAEAKQLVKDNGYQYRAKFDGQTKVWVRPDLLADKAA